MEIIAGLLLLEIITGQLSVLSIETLIKWSYFGRFLDAP